LGQCERQRINTMNRVCFLEVSDKVHATEFIESSENSGHSPHPTAKACGISPTKLSVSVPGVRCRSMHRGRKGSRSQTGDIHVGRCPEGTPPGGGRLERPVLPCCFAPALLPGLDARCPIQAVFGAAWELWRKKSSPTLFGRFACVRTGSNTVERYRLHAASCLLYVLLLENI
jgi:hypothetical protein